MGFAATLRRTVQASRNANNVVEDVTALSKNIVKEAEKFNVRELSDFFGTKYLRNVDSKLMIGTLPMDDFVKYVRLGNYVNSFQAAFANTNLLSSPAVQRTVRRVLANATAQLPDAQLLKATENAKKVGQKYKLSGKTFASFDEFDKLVKDNPALAKDVNGTLRKARSKRFLKMIGYSVAVGAGGLTAAELYQLAANEAAKNTGCFRYTKKGTELIKCKISKFSCKNPQDGKLCPENELPASINDNKTACTDSNKDPCLNDQCVSSKYPDLSDQDVLKCETKTTGDVIAEAISSAGSSALGFLTGTFSTILIWGLVIVGIMLVVLFLVRFVFSRFVGG